MIPSNDDRAAWAWEAVRTFMARTGMPQEDAPTAMVDLLADLRHLADRVDLDWEELRRRADGHYRLDRDDEEAEREYLRTLPPEERRRYIEEERRRRPRVPPPPRGRRQDWRPWRP